jgi:hypothetical protein
MIEDVMYGDIFRANIDICVKEPPVKLLRNPKLVWNEIHWEKYSLSIPGTGSREPILTMISAIKV